MTDSIVPGLALGISTLSLGVSATTAWLTLFRRGQVKMTRPTMIALTGDGREKTTKVVVRALLYSSAARGNIVESLHAVLRHETTSVTLAFWAYGEATGLQRGGGLFVGREGVALNHHFTLNRAGNTHHFQSGTHTLEIQAAVLGEPLPRKLTACSFDIGERMADTLNSQLNGIMFNWNPNNNAYEPDESGWRSPGAQGD